MTLKTNAIKDEITLTPAINLYFYDLIINKLNKRQFLRFTNNHYMTDNGWILENKKKL